MKHKKLYTSILLLTIVALFSCGGKDGENLPAIIGSTTKEQDVHHVDGTLHNIKVSDSDTPFVVNGTSEYKIVYHNDNNWGYKAAAFIRNEIRNATGATLETIDGDNYSSYNVDDRIICIDVRNIISEAGITITSENIGNAGYQLTTKNGSAFIYCNSGYGYVHAARRFLKETIGYEIYSTDITVYRKSGETLPNMDIVEAPDITYRLQSNKMDADTAYKMGFLTFAEAFYGKNGVPTQHNSTVFIKPSV